MHRPFSLLLFVLIPFLPHSSSSTRYHTTLTRGSSLSPPEDHLVSSPTGIFTAGFHPVGGNAYCFAIWFTEPLADGNVTVVWMANRDQPVNGRNTKLSLLDSGNLVLKDAGQIVVWKSATSSTSSVRLQLRDNGNLVLQSANGLTIWESFDSPTDTLLPRQSLTRNTRLVSQRSETNYSSGFYKLFFDNDNILRLIYDGVEITSVFWPPSFLLAWNVGRSPYNASKIATLDLAGHFLSSDKFQFKTSDLGIGPMRRMRLDPDGNLRVYSLDRGESIWKVTWLVTPQQCKTHGICGANSMCTYTPESGPRCSCLPGYRMKNHRDWSEGCLPEFEISCNDNNSSYFLKLSHVEFYGYDDIGYYRNHTLEDCKQLCSSHCSCKGFQYKFDRDDGVYSCFLKNLLINGYQSTGFDYWIYLRLPNSGTFSESDQEPDIQCPRHTVVQLNRTYKKKREPGWLRSLLWSTGAVGAFEIMCLLIFLYKTRLQNGASEQQYLQVATGFKRFTYAELKTASRNFSEEIGRGGSGVVYKGKLSDNRVAAIKRLHEACQGEAEFLAEVSLIGKLNHANLIEPWGYCVEGKHRLLVYEYLAHGSLAENINSDKLDWRKWFDIALGTAKGLAYLHEECLEWVLHCDVKPENILLDSNYQPKVADFGLSKLLNRSNHDHEQSNVSQVRGTRGYMAPEWVFHLPITSKVDVYSYGVVVLEMVTGRSPKGLGGHAKRLVSWVREMTNSETADGSESWVEQIVDHRMKGQYDVVGLENLVRVALQCVQDNKDDRPTMRQVIHILLGQETNASS